MAIKKGGSFFICLRFKGSISYFINLDSYGKFPRESMDINQNIKPINSGKIADIYV